MENCSKCLNDLRKEIEEKVNNELDELISNKLQTNHNLTNDSFLAEFIADLDLKSIENDLINKHKLTTTNNKQIKTKISTKQLWNSSEDFDEILQNLSSKSKIVRIKTLNGLLNTQIIDTKQKYWGNLSKILLNNFISSSPEIFDLTLKIHHRILTFPNTTHDGFINLLNGIVLLVNSRVVENRFKQTLKLVLKAQTIWIRIRLNCKEIEEVIQLFISIVVNKFDYLISLDVKANWMRNFCWNSQTRLIFFKQLKSTDLIQLVLDSFLNYASNGSLNDKELHCCYILVYFVSFEDFSQTKVSSQQIVRNLLNKIKQTNNYNQELKGLVVELFENNPGLVVNEEIQLLLIEPFQKISENANKIQEINKTIATNQFLITIIGNLTKTQYSDYLFINYSKFVNKSLNRKFSNRNNNLFFLQKFLDLLVILIRNFINESENNRKVNDSIRILLSLLKTSYNNCQSLTLNFLKTNSKLLLVLKDFYRTLTNFDDEIDLEILEFYYHIFGNYNNFSVPENEKQFVDELMIDLSNCDQFKSVLFNSLIVRKFLENIWFNFEKTNSENELNEAIRNFLLAIYKAQNLQQVLSNDSNDFETIIPSDKPLSLSELIETCTTSEEECYLGLLVVKVLINTNLDVMVQLQANYKLQEKLQELQENCRVDDNSAIIIDDCSSLRHSILMSLKFVGFVDLKLNQNLLEQTQLIIGNCSDNYCTVNVNNKNYKQLNELQKFLNSVRSGLHDYGWVIQVKRAFKSILIEPYKTLVLTDLIKQVPKIYVYRKIDFQWPQTDSVYYQLYPEDFIGISTIIKYFDNSTKTKLISTFGSQKGILTASNNEENLILLIKQTRTFLNYQPKFFHNFDWFVGILFLICEGNYEKCKLALIDIVNMQITPLIWSTFGNLFDKLFQERFYQQLLIILELENQTVFQGLKMLQLSPIDLAKTWLNQCFFNLLEFEEICNFIGFAVLYSPDCLIFYLIAIFQHLRNNICTATYNDSVEDILNITDMSSFKLSNYMDLIEKLIKQYKNVIRL